MKRKWLKWVKWIILAPIILFTTLMILLYIPAVQNLVCKKAIKYASQATGMNINIGRIDLRFPINLLIRDIQINKKTDTLLKLQSLNVKVQAISLIKGKIELDNFTAKKLKINSDTLIDGMNISGELGKIYIQSHGVNLKIKEAIINTVEIEDGQIKLINTEPVKQTLPDTSTTEVTWKIDLHSLNLNSISFNMQTPKDSTNLNTHLERVKLQGLNVDLQAQAYKLKQLKIEDTKFSFNKLIALEKINIDIDSVLYNKNSIQATLKECSMYDQTGINIASLTAKIIADSSQINVPLIQLKTPYSAINIKGTGNWQFVHNPQVGNISINLNGQIGKQDILLIGEKLPKEFIANYPQKPLEIEASVNGNLEKMNIPGINITLPGNIAMECKGELANITDSINRKGNIDILANTQKINFLPLTIPNNIAINSNIAINGENLEADLLFSQDKGNIKIAAALNIAEETYKTDVEFNDFKVQNFLPKDSLYNLTAQISANGKGLDILSPKSRCNINANVSKLQYAKYNLSGITVEAELKNLLATAKLEISNYLLKMDSQGKYNLAQNYPNGELNAEVKHIGFYELGLTPTPLRKNIEFKISADVNKESINAKIVSSDLEMSLKTGEGVDSLIKQSVLLSQRLTKQLNQRELNLDNIRETLPSAEINIKAGNNNLLSWYLNTHNIHLNKIDIDFNTNPEQGINGYAYIDKIRIDTLQLDTVFLTIKQDTNKLLLKCGIPDLTLNGEITQTNAELITNYINKQGITSLLFGVNARSMTNKEGQKGGIVFSLIPQNPIIAGKKFNYKENKNWIYLHNNNRVYANINMSDNQGVGIDIQSLPTDTTSLQNINLNLTNIDLEQLLSIIPSMPHIKGILSAKAHFIQTEESLQVSAEAGIDKLWYEKEYIGNLGIKGTWLPGTNGEQNIQTYLSLNKNKILSALGTISKTAEKKDSINIVSKLENFPLTLANAFIPTKLAKLEGNLDGNLKIDGNFSSPIINGEIKLDSVDIASSQYGAKIRLDNHPINIKNNKLIFENFAIYTINNNPFTINGNISFADITNPIANLKLYASNYTLLDAKKTKESLVYGKVAIDLDATLRGSLSALVMRGNVSLLNNTNATYILTDSPLTVQDRLNGLVTFTNFADTSSISKQEIPKVTLGGLDMAMNISIAPNVQLQVDLSQDQSNKVQLQGGGNLTLIYTPQGELSLTGRYTLSGGIIKYSLPVIPLKEFQITNGSYVEWTGNPMDPILNLSATEKIKASVGQENGSSRVVQFEISIIIKNTLEDLSLSFDINAPNDAQIQNELALMSPDERQKNAIAMLATGVYLPNSGKGGFNMDAAINSVLSNQINNLMGNIKGASFNVGIDNNSTNTGANQTDYSFSYSQRFFNDRFQIIIGGKVSTGAEAQNSADSFIDNVRLEYRLDNSGTRYIQLFYDKNYESILEGEVTEAGIGIVLRRKMDKFKELFIFRSKNGKNKNK